MFHKKLEVIDADALLVPIVEAVDAFVDFNLMMPSEVVKFLYIRELLQRAVGLRSIPSDFAKETDFLLNQFGHLADADFLARAYVDMTVANLGDAVGILPFNKTWTDASAISSLHKNSRMGRPVPQSVTAFGSIP